VQTAEPIEMLFAIWTWVGLRKHALNGGAHWRHMANKIEPSMCGGDAAFLSNYFDHLLLSLIRYFSDKYMQQPVMALCMARDSAGFCKQHLIHLVKTC